MTTNAELGAQGRADTLRAVRYLWAEHGRVTVRDVAAETGRNVTSTCQYLRQLRNAGKVIYDGPGTYRPAGLRPARYVRLIDAADLVREHSPGG